MNVQRNTVGLGLLAALLLVFALVWTRRDAERGRSSDVAPERVGLEVPQLSANGSSQAPLIGERSEQRGAKAGDAPSLATNALVVEVRDAFGQPLADAELTFAPFDAESAAIEQIAERMGTSAPDGKLQISLPPTVAGELRAKRAGYAPSGTSWKPGGSALVVIVLEPARELRGRVAYAGGEHVQEAVTVVAWPTRSIPGSASWREVRAGRSSAACKMTVTDEDGRFRFADIESASRYSLIALGESAMSLAPVEVLANLRDEVLLELHAIYSVEIVVRAAGNAAMRANPRLFGEGPSWSLAAQARARSLLALPPWAQARAESATPAPDAPTPLGGRLYFSTPSPQSSVGGIHYTVTVPGYQPISSELTAEPLGARADPVELEAMPLETCWGTLRVIVSRPAGAPSELLGRFRSLGTLHLRDERGASYNLQVRQTPDGFENLPGVPCGRYHARFRSNSTHFEHPPREEPPMLVVVEPGPAESPVRVDLEHVATFVLELVDDDGAPCLDWAGVELIGVSPLVDGLREEFFFEGPSYVIDAVPPGDYVVKLAQLPGCDATADSQALLPAIDGDVVRATLTAKCRQ